MPEALARPGTSEGGLGFGREHLTLLGFPGVQPANTLDPWGTLPCCCHATASSGGVDGKNSPRRREL